MGYLRNLGRSLIGRTPSLDQKASAVGSAIARMSVNMPVWSQRDFEKLGKEGYQQNPVVARAINLIAQNTASVPIKIVKGRGKSTTEIDDHELLDLLDAPNLLTHGTEFMEAVISHLLITGNCFIERTNEDAFKQMELYTLRPDRTKVVPGEDGLPMAYEYGVNGTIRRFEVDFDKQIQPVLHLKRFHPVNDWYGMSPLDPAAWAIDLHNSCGAWNKALLDNAASPSGAFVYSGDPGGGNRMSDDGYNRLKIQVDEQMSGSRNTGKPIILEGGLDWKPMSFTAKEMEQVEMKNQAAREIAFAIGVPPMLLGIQGDNTYNNYLEANRAFHRQTVLPMLNFVLRGLQAWFADILGDGVRIVPDLDSVTALQIERDALFTRLNACQFMTINEKREAVDLERKDGGDDLYQPAGQLAIGNHEVVQGGPAPDDASWADDASWDDAPADDGKQPPAKRSRYKPGLNS